MIVGVIGSGGREHALCYKLKQSKKIKNLFCIPGNAGTKNIATNLDIDILNLPGSTIKTFCAFAKANSPTGK